MSEKPQEPNTNAPAPEIKSEQPPNKICSVCKSKHTAKWVSCCECRQWNGRHKNGCPHSKIQYKTKNVSKQQLKASKKAPSKQQLTGASVIKMDQEQKAEVDALRDRVRDQQQEIKEIKEEKPLQTQLTKESDIYEANKKFVDVSVRTPMKFIRTNKIKASSFIWVFIVLLMNFTVWYFGKFVEKFLMKLVAIAVSLLNHTILKILDFFFDCMISEDAVTSHIAYYGTMYLVAILIGPHFAVLKKLTLNPWYWSSVVTGFKFVRNIQFDELESLSTNHDVNIRGEIRHYNPHLVEYELTYYKKKPYEVFGRLKKKKMVASWELVVQACSFGNVFSGYTEDVVTERVKSFMRSQGTVNYDRYDDTEGKILDNSAHIALAIYRERRREAIKMGLLG